MPKKRFAPTASSTVARMTDATKANDEKFMKTTVVTYDPKTEEPIVNYEEFEHSLIKARPRNYAVAKKE